MKQMYLSSWLWIVGLINFYFWEANFLPYYMFLETFASMLPRYGHHLNRIEVGGREWERGEVGHEFMCRNKSHPSSSPPKIALKWTPEGKRSRGRPKETWRRTIERERKKEWTWSSMEKMAQDRSKWRTLTSALCTPGTKRIK